MKYLPLLIAIFLLNYTSIFSQEKLLKDDFYLQIIENCESGELMKEPLWDLSTISHDSLRVSIRNASKKFQTVQASSIVNDTLNLGLEKFEILKHSKDSLVLIQAYDTICRKLKFTSKLNLIEQQKKHFFLHESDTIYFANEWNTPKINGKSNILHYFSMAFPVKSYGPKPCKVKLQFIISKTGEILSPRGNFICKKEHPEKALKFILKTEGMWEPMYLDGKPVNTLVRLRFTHNPPVEKEHRVLMYTEQVIRTEEVSRSRRY